MKNELKLFCAALALLALAAVPVFMTADSDDSSANATVTSYTGLQTALSGTDNDISITGAVTVPSGDTLTVPSGKIFTIGSGGSFTNNGSVLFQVASSDDFFNDRSLIRAESTSSTGTVTFQLTQDVTTANAYSFNVNATLDLNGHTWTANGVGEAFVLSGAATMVVTDSGTGGAIVRLGTNTNDNFSAIRVGDGTTTATLKMNSGTITAQIGYGVYVMAQNKAYFEPANGKTITITAYLSAISMNGTQHGETLVISGGNYTSQASACIYAPSTTELTVTGGVFTGKTGFDIRGGNAKINNCTINVNQDGSIDKTGNTGPSSFGFGISLFDIKAYSASTVEIGNGVTFNREDGTLGDIYAGALEVNADNGKYDLNKVGTTYTGSHGISLTVAGVKYDSAANTNAGLLFADLSKSTGQMVIVKDINLGDATLTTNGNATYASGVSVTGGTVNGTLTEYVEASQPAVAKTYTVTIPYVYGSGVNYTNSTTVAAGGSFFFYAWANDGYQLDSVTANHGQITRVNGGYQLSNITSDTVITIAVSEVAEQNEETESEEISPAIAAAALCVICVAGMLLAVVVISKKR